MKAGEEVKYIDKTIIVPATAKVVPTQHVVYDCADGSALYRKSSTTVGFFTTSSTGYLTAGGGITSGDESYYRDSNPADPKDDGEHYCITKEHTTTPPKSSTD